MRARLAIGLCAAAAGLILAGCSADGDPYGCPWAQALAEMPEPECPLATWLEGMQEPECPLAKALENMQEPECPLMKALEEMPEPECPLEKWIADMKVPECWPCPGPVAGSPKAAATRPAGAR